MGLQQNYLICLWKPVDLQKKVYGARAIRINVTNFSPVINGCLSCVGIVLNFESCYLPTPRPSESLDEWHCSILLSFLLGMSEKAFREDL